ncbi:hypothetical protein [Glycomyces xiaoerkulensis]|uniref:hypothetical protein n=1 Tax=Glycomyces xiaoerkulensis TaxID=2038139 RepID=UPI001300113B|nr:hypothetical protein [Glycomyces xiaoerkulensis]
MVNSAESALRARMLEIQGLFNESLSILRSLQQSGALHIDENRPSQAAMDAAMTLAGPSGEWKDSQHCLRPRALALKFVHEQAGFCRSLALLTADPYHSFDSMCVISRAIAERSGRIAWILDPTVDHKIRCARAYLVDLVSLHHLVPSRLIEPSDGVAREKKAKDKEKSKAMKREAKELFDPATFENEPSTWNVAGETYISWTDALMNWARANELSIDGEALYNLLAVTSHPQGFTAVAGTDRHPYHVGVLGLKTSQVEKTLRLSLTLYYSSLTQCANYHGVDEQAYSGWEAKISEVYPGFFAQD